MNVIEIDRLVKTYGSIRALDGFDLTVPRGSIFGFLGPNGAGKSTTIRILLGLLRRESGDARVFEMDPWRDRSRIAARVGYLPGDFRFSPRWTGAQFLAFCGRSRGGRYDAEIARLSRVFDLDTRRRIRSYSRGMKQKLGLIQALMHAPDLLILDEPGTGLDPLMLRTLYDEQHAAAANGATILFSSHTLAEVDHLCDRIAVIRNGCRIESGTMADIRARAPRRVAFRLANGQNVAPNNAFLRAESSNARVTGAWTGPTAELLGWLRSMQVEEVEIGAPTLEELFLKLYRDRTTSPEDAA